MELPSSRCRRRCLKAMFDNMPRWRAEVDVSCAFHTTRRDPLRTLRLALVATDCGCGGCHLESFQSCSWCKVELPTSRYSLNTSMTKRLRAEDLFVSVVVFKNLRVQHATSLLQR